MNRRRFLSFLGIAPIAAVGGAVVAKAAPAKGYWTPSYFDKVPRWGSGGIVGGEAPIIAHVGERVFTREQIEALGFAIDSSRADEAAVHRLKAQLAQHRRDLPGIIKDTIARAKKG